ncbi:MAG: efflux RND transporter periplasmic adaptor subunit [Gemmatimonadaceae bacterium]|nr:efflux RND transporter periplasmic adaptor subunit [Gemmatimonadaceae bacterium]
MKGFPLKGRTLALAAVLLALLGLFAYVALRSGPLAPVAVTVATVESRSVAPGVFGIGTVESRYRYRVGPTVAGRVKRLMVDVGDSVVAGQLMGEMDPVDLDERLRALDAVYRRGEATVHEAELRRDFAQTQMERYEQLLAVRSTSEEIVASKQQERHVADAALLAIRAELARAGDDRAALVAQRRNLRLVAPADGLVIARDVDPGTTVVAGQMVVEIVDPETLWLSVRFDQGSTRGLQAGLSTQILLRSRRGEPLTGRVVRVEPRADAVTEETVAKVAFNSAPDPLPPIGELAEVTVGLPAAVPAPVIPNAAVQRVDGQSGVWMVVGGDLQFTPVTLGPSDLDGNVQVRSGLTVGDRIVVYSAKALSARSRITVVDRIAGVAR